MKRCHPSIDDPCGCAPFVILALFLAVLCQQASGQCYIDQWGRRICPPTTQQSASYPQVTPAKPHPSRCRIQVPANGPYVDYGTGTLIDNPNGIVLTCNHILTDAQGQPVCIFPDGRRFVAQVIARDPANDLAALRIRSPGIETLPVDTSEPSGLLTVGGFGSSGQFHASAGYVVGRSVPVGATGPGVEVSADVVSGDSGGGAVDAQRRFRGVLWGGTAGRTHITCGQPLRQFLDRVLPGRPGVVIPRANNGSVGGTPGMVPVQPIPQEPAVEAPIDKPSMDLEALEQWQAEQEALQKKRFEELKSLLVDRQTPATEPPKQEPDDHPSLAGTGKAIATSGLTHILTTLGISAGVAAPISGIGVWLAGRRIKKRLAERSNAKDGAGGPSVPFRAAA